MSEFLRKWYFDKDTLNAALDYVDLANGNFKRAATISLRKQQAVWTQWVPTRVALRVKKALKTSNG